MGAVGTLVCMSNSVAIRNSGRRRTADGLWNRLGCRGDDLCDWIPVGCGSDCAVAKDHSRRIDRLGRRLRGLPRRAGRDLRRRHSDPEEASSARRLRMVGYLYRRFVGCCGMGLSAGDAVVIGQRLRVVSIVPPASGPRRPGGAELLCGHGQRPSLYRTAAPERDGAPPIAASRCCWCRRARDGGLRSVANSYRAGCSRARSFGGR